MKQKIKDFSNKDCCLNCNAFCWWDGDYCCTQEMSIHQFGWRPYNPSEIWFTEDIDKTMKTPATCEDYEYNEFHHNYVNEYKRFKIWDKLCKQLEAHVSNPSGIYKV